MNYLILNELFIKNPNLNINLEEKDNPISWIKEIQQLLNDKGFNAGKVDGIAGPNTLRALENAKNYLFLEFPALIGKTTFDKLLNMEKIDDYPILRGLFKINPDLTIDLKDKNTDTSWIKEIQHLLNDKGFNAGKVDGIAGSNTLRALENAKNALYLQYPELIGKTTFDKLLNFNPKNQNLLYLPTGGIGRITSPFDPNRKHPISGQIRPHRGIDIGASQGVIIYAVAEGIVNAATNNCKEGNTSCGGGFGNHIRINHSKALFDESVYAHLQSCTVSLGEFCKAGQKIGYLGNTGSSTGPHLHFETWVKGKAIDPLNFFNPIV